MCIRDRSNTSSLPDLSNLSIPSPIHAPIDMEQENSNKAQNQNNHVSPEQPTFQVPFRVPPRRSAGKQIYSRQIGSNPDVLESLHREKLNLNFANLEKADLNVSTNSNNVSQSAPLSPVTPPPYYWNSTPMSPLATSDLIVQQQQQQQQQANSQAELQQQMSQFQINSDTMNNGMGNPPPYPYIGENETMNNFNYPYSKQSLMRINSGPAQINSSQDCDRQLDSELMKLRQQDNANSELSEADLNSVRVALDPLDFDDVQILSGNNTELVDQSAEEAFRLERAGYP